MWCFREPENGARASRSDRRDAASVPTLAITFEGTLSSWWTRIAIGTLLLIFILLQKLIESTARYRSSKVRGM